jgi:hypothetical protein
MDFPTLNLLMTTWWPTSRTAKGLGGPDISKPPPRNLTNIAVALSTWLPSPPLPQKLTLQPQGTPYVAPVVTPPPAGGLLPGELASGMGPYKRPGQVFGEQDPYSPFLTSLPAAAPAPVVQPAPVEITAAPPVVIAPKDDSVELAVALLFLNL